MSRPLRVLIVEDSPDDAELMVLALRRGGFDPSAERVETADGMRAALGRGPWDVVLLDYTLPGFDVLAALELLGRTGLDLPFLVVSGTVGDEQAARVMKARASDYILKQSLARLAPAVERELREAAGRRARRAAERDAYQLAAVVQSSEDAILAKALDGTITSWNPAAERLYGWSAAEIVGRPIVTLIPPDRAGELAGITERMRRGERV